MEGTRIGTLLWVVRTMEKLVGRKLEAVGMVIVTTVMVCAAGCVGTSEVFAGTVDILVALFGNVSAAVGLEEVLWGRAVGTLWWWCGESLPLLRSSC